MISAKLVRYFLLLLLLTSSTVKAQSDGSDSARFDEVQSLVRFYEYMLNTIGDKNTPTRDKEVVINESYKKVFAGSDVQIEDDLADDRQVITNKDVNAYLRDVDFFFEDASFHFSEIDIKKGRRSNGQPFYLVNFNSTIDAVTVSGDVLKTSNPRFLEVNLDTSNADLKIASVYTTKVSRAAELRNWWEQLSYGWVRVFKKLVPYESITDEILLQIGEIDSVNISGNQFIMDIQPLQALRELRYVNISETKIEDLTPLRYAKNIKTLNAANTNIHELEVLAYVNELQKLDLSRTPLQSLNGIAKTSNLKSLNLSGSDVLDFQALSGLSSLDSLDLSNTAFANVELIANCTKLKFLKLDRTGTLQLHPLGTFSQLTYLDISETYVSDLNALSSLNQLQNIRLDQTAVRSLEPLKKITGLQKVYADYSGVTEQHAADFMQTRPNVAVITNSAHLKEWWNKLPNDWRELLSGLIGMKNPSEEALVKFLNTDSLNLKDLRLVNADPLKKFKRLKFLNISQNLFVNLGFTREMRDLETLIAMGVPVSDVNVLVSNKELTALNLSNTQVTDISVCLSLNRLKTLEIDGASIDKEQIRKVLDYNPDLVIIFQTEHLAEWWDSLSGAWRAALGLSSPTSFELHQLIEKQTLNIKNQPIVSLRTLDEFIQLKELELTNTGVTSLIDLSEQKALEKIICTNGPLMNLDGIVHHQNLLELNISNTAVDDLKPLRSISNLKSLNCSGTNVKKLKGLEELKNLEFLNISNTRVWQLHRLYDIRNLKSLICYNTRLRDQKIEDFRAVFPDCVITYY